VACVIVLRPLRLLPNPHRVSGRRRAAESSDAHQGFGQAGNSALPALPVEQDAMMIDGMAQGRLATHPPIMDRIADGVLLSDSDMAMLSPADLRAQAAEVSVGGGFTSSRPAARRRADGADATRVTLAIADSETTEPVLDRSKPNAPASPVALRPALRPPLRPYVAEALVFVVSPSPFSATKLAGYLLIRRQP